MDKRIFILFTFFLLFGCSNNHLVENQTYEIVEINDYYDRPVNGYMRTCSINKSPTYTYVVYQGNAYQKVEDSEGLLTETIVTKKELCTSERQHQHEWKCFDLTPGDYISYYNSIADNTKYPANQALGLECEDKIYDKSVFNI
ncbi:MAG: hypothetical protein KAQ83_04675 [Nanoarchaeota archaeon]|nr:hypothetical protein [Nanoarchaeota archaeon]